eukprot:g7936.t1
MGPKPENHVGQALVAAAPATTAAASRERDHAGSEVEATAPTAAAAAPAAGKKKKANKKKKKKKTPQDCNSNKTQHAPTIYAGLGGFDTFKITQDAVSGRCVVASRDLEAGELVLHEPPFAKVVRRDCADRQCASCCRHVADGGKVEADAPFAVYCSRACKAREAALRSAEAGAIGKLAGISAARDVDIDLLRMVLRLLITRARALSLQPPDSDSESGGGGGEKAKGEHENGDGGDSQEGTFLLEQWHNLYALMHHREDMAPQWVEVVRTSAEDLAQALPEWARFDVEEVVQLACRVNVNAHGLRDDSGSNAVIGVGMFPLAAMINHSCRPNCTFVYFGGQLEVRTLEPVAAGADLCVYYIDLLQGTTARRRELLASKHFLCKCPRCENPSPVDEHLDRVCCVDCGAVGCLSSSPPPTAEDILAAQLEQLGEVGDFTSGQGNGKGKGNKKKGGGSGKGGAATGALKGDVPGAPLATDANCANSRGKEAASEGLMYCSACGRQYSAAVVEDSVARAKSSWDGAMAVLRAKNFSLARKSLEKWLQDYDAGSVAAANVGKKKPAKKDRPKLHPANALVVQTLVPLSNCCNFEEDFAASARHLRRAVLSMEAVYPPNYPELGDFHAALAEANASLLEKRGQALPKKTRSQTDSERKQSLERAAAIRTVCLGREHPTTKKAVAALDRSS